VAEVDITGAGDSAAAVLISGFLREKSTEKLINLTNEIASKFVALDRTEFPSSNVQADFQRALKD
jgi:fructose-1-phosphate kinase PfkB-like protein